MASQGDVGQPLLLGQSLSRSRRWTTALKVCAVITIGIVALTVVAKPMNSTRVSKENPVVDAEEEVPIVAVEKDPLSETEELVGHFPPVNVAKPQLVLGWPTSGYHNVTIWIYVKALQQLGYTDIKLITHEHPKLYPMLTGGESVGHACKEKGCAELCREAGFDHSPCVDIVADSNIPVNHATWLEVFQNQFDVIGTCFENQFIGLFAPDYVPFHNISGATSYPGVDKTIYGFKSGPGEGCDSSYCPKCSVQAFLHNPPVSNNGFHWKGFSCPDFEKVLAKKLANKDLFIVETWIPNYWSVRFPELRPLNMEQYESKIKPNQGKILIRKDRKYKLTAKALSVMGAIFIGTEEVQKMDGWQNGFGPGVSGPLCDYWDYDHGCAEEAAQKWIDENRANKLWDSFFW